MGSGSVVSLIRQTVAEMLALPSPVLADNAKLRIALVDPICQILVSGPHGDTAFRSAAATALGFDLPVEPNHLAGKTAKAFWMAPGQWLVVSDDGADADLAQRLERAAGPAGGFVSDVADGFARFELSGTDARRVMAMGCALDFDSPAMAPGRCARTLFAGLHVLLYPWGSRDGYRIHTERQFALYLWEWLEKASSGAM
jgi:sarcosine oxidase subunit gamma